jgi:hypothetical protein
MYRVNKDVKLSSSTRHDNAMFIIVHCSNSTLSFLEGPWHHSHQCGTSVSGVCNILRELVFHRKQAFTLESMKENCCVRNFRDWVIEQEEMKEQLYVYEFTVKFD